MAIYYKFMSTKNFSTIKFDSPFISVASLKREILGSKYKATIRSDSNGNRHDSNGFCMGTDWDLRVINAQTNEEYVKDSDLIPRGTSVLLRRVPGNKRGDPIYTAPIVAEPREEPGVVSVVGTGSSAVISGDEDASFDFGDDVFAPTSVVSVESCKLASGREEDEESKINALVNTPALVYDGSGYGGQGDKAVGGFRRMGGGRGFGVLEGRTPPVGYVCYRCSVPGHYIQHCPTNGDPNYDIKRMRPPTGIPKSMLVVNPDGSYNLPKGGSAVLKPDEDAFDKEMSGLSSSSRSSCVTNSVPPELFCPLCEQVMKDAVLTSRCCFKSFCDKCIRDHLINSKLRCVCGATNILTDGLIPNMTLRDTIKRISESGSCSSNGDNVSSAFQAQKMESAVSPTNDRKRPSPANVEADELKDGVLAATSHHSAKKFRRAEAAGLSKAELESVDVRYQASDKDAALNTDEVQQKATMGEARKQKKKKKSSQEAAQSYMTPMGSYGYYDSLWNATQPWVQGYMNQYASGSLPYYAYNMNFNGMPLPNVQDYAQDF